jgi:hypothetical protein
MIPLRGTLKGNFLQQLQKRINAYSGAVVAARVRVPDSLNWWYWNEFGTATRGDQGRGSGHTYEIKPVTAEFLRFVGRNGLVFVKAIEAHPGIPPSRSVTRALPDIRRTVRELVHAAFTQHGADNPKVLEGAIVEATEQAKQHIVDSMDRNLNQGVLREDGRLEGRTAAQAFQVGAEVVNLSN